MIKKFRSPSTGIAFHGFWWKDWGVVVQQDEFNHTTVFTYETEAEAKEASEAVAKKFAPHVNYVEKLELADGNLCSV